MQKFQQKNSCQSMYKERAENGRTETRTDITYHNTSRLWRRAYDNKKKSIRIAMSFYRPYLKPQSDIRYNRFATSPPLTIYTNRRGRNKVSDRSRRGCREVGDWSGTSLRPNQSQPGFCACTKTWLRLIWSQTGPGKVADQSPISRRLVADRSPTNFVRIGAWLSLKLVGDWSAIGRRLIGDLSATSLQLVGDLVRNLLINVFHILISHKLFIQLLHN